MRGGEQHNANTSFWARLLRLDPRWIYASVLVIIVIPFFAPVKLPIERQEPALDLYGVVDAIPAGGRMLIAFDYGTSNTPECDPMVEALLRHAFLKGVIVYTVCGSADGVALAQRAFDRVAPRYGKRNRTDYVNDAYRPNYTNVIMVMASDVRNVYSTDSGGTPLNDIPAIQGFRNYDDIALVVSVSGSHTPESWIGLAGARKGVRVAAGVTAVLVADFYTLWTSGQLEGLLCGMKGAAEYEEMLTEKLEPDHGIGRATRGMASQSAAHIMIVALVVFGNIAMTCSARPRGAKRGRRR